MSFVQVMFRLDPTDEDDDSGLTTEDWEAVNDALAELGADAVEITLVKS